MALPIFIGDVGTVIELTIKDENGDAVNVSAATVKQIKFDKPGAAPSVTKTAVFSTNGSDGKIRYTTITGDIDVPGEWKARGYVELGSSVKFHTSSVSFDVVVVE